MAKDFSSMGLIEAIEWTVKNTKFNDVRKRMASRQAAFQLLKALEELAQNFETVKMQLQLEIDYRNMLIRALNANPEAVKLISETEEFKLWEKQYELNTTSEGTTPTLGRTEEKS